MRIVTLTTDFGMEDWFVGTMKGVIAAINPKASVIDITHAIAGGDIRAGAFALAASYKYFPKGTVHVAVVDPGVGSKRKAIAIETERYFFVGPDNGVLTFALRDEKIKAIHALENTSYFLKSVSQTFHGRDVFAPVAAHLARGVAIGKLGSVAAHYVRLDWPEPKQRGKVIEAEIIYIDKFGNAITNIPGSSISMVGDVHGGVFKQSRLLCPIGKFYESVVRGKPVAVIGSSGHLEIAVNGGSAAAKLGLRIGHRVHVRPSKTQFAAERAGDERKDK